MAEKLEEMAEDKIEEEPFPWHLRVFDAHCHPTDSPASIDQIPSMKARALIIMATRSQDQETVAQFTDSHGITHTSTVNLLESDNADNDKQCRIIPSFGWHPWFSHQIYDDTAAHLPLGLNKSDKVNHYRAVIDPFPDDEGFLRSLPDPRPLSAYLAQTRQVLESHPYALIGEIGLDRTFRIPDHRENSTKEEASELTPGGREGKRLTPYRVRIEHQKSIFKAQLNLAGELSRAVSVHGVAAHGIVFETLRETWHGHEKKKPSKRTMRRNLSFSGANSPEHKVKVKDEVSNHESPRPFPPRICLHSYSGPSDVLKQYLDPAIPATIFFSFSHVINFSHSTSSKVIDAIKAVPDDRILVESDLHCAGKQLDDLLERITRTICQIKRWSLEDGIRQLGSNWLHFAFGKHSPKD